MMQLCYRQLMILLLVDQAAAQRFLTVESHLPRESVEARIQAILARDQAETDFHYELLTVKDESIAPFVGSTNPGLEQCVRYQQWLRQFDSVLYVRSSQGSAIYRWNAARQAGDWQQLRGALPVQSPDQRLTITGAAQPGSFFAFQVITNGVPLSDRIRSEAIALVRTFTQHDAFLQLRSDNRIWPRECGRPAPHTFSSKMVDDSSRPSTSTDWCGLRAGVMTCQWRTVEHRVE